MGFLCFNIMPVLNTLYEEAGRTDYLGKSGNKVPEISVQTCPLRMPKIFHYSLALSYLIILFCRPFKLFCCLVMTL